MIKIEIKIKINIKIKIEKKKINIEIMKKIKPEKKIKGETINKISQNLITQKINIKKKIILKIKII